MKLSVNDFIIKAWPGAAAGPGLQRGLGRRPHPALKPSDVAVAVAIEGGLFTPVLRDAERKTLSALSGRDEGSRARARSRKLAPHEYQGGASPSPTSG